MESGSLFMYHRKYRMVGVCSGGGFFLPHTAAFLSLCAKYSIMAVLWKFGVLRCVTALNESTGSFWCRHENLLGVPHCLKDKKITCNFA
jgi:hypothetical protein